jgi:hypothetical protein
MNTLTKQFIKGNFKRVNRFYQIISKNKFKRDIQQGLTRYNFDSMNYEQLPYEVKILIKIEIKTDSWI